MPELNVLVVDDEPAIRQVLSAAITKAGYAVDTAGSAAEALGKLDKLPYDVVISDVFMPVTDGIELLRLARAKGHGATFIMSAPQRLVLLAQFSPASLKSDPISCTSGSPLSCSAAVIGMRTARPNELSMSGTWPLLASTVLAPVVWHW